MSDIMTAAGEDELHESCGHIGPSFIKTSGVGFILAASRGPSQRPETANEVCTRWTCVAVLEARCQIDYLKCI